MAMPKVQGMGMHHHWTSDACFIGYFLLGRLPEVSNGMSHYQFGLSR